MSSLAKSWKKSWIIQLLDKRRTCMCHAIYGVYRSALMFLWGFNYSPRLWLHGVDAKMVCWE